MKIKRRSPLCHAGSEPHPLSLKKLINVKFKKEQSKNICLVCLKTFTNGMGAIVIKPCGDVVCKHCHGKFIKKKHECVCDKKTEGIIEIQADGTGFTAAGNAEAVKHTPAFM